MDLLDDGFTLDRDRVGHRDRLGHMVRSGHLHNSLHRLDHFIGHIVGLLNMDRLVDGMHLLLHSDNRGSHGLGTLEGSGHSNLEVRNGRLQDLSGIAGNVGSLAQVNLLGDDGLGLVQGGDIGQLFLGDVRGWQGDLSGSVSQGSGSVSISQRGSVRQRGSVQQASRSCGNVTGGSESAGKQGRKDILKIIVNG